MSSDDGSLQWPPRPEDLRRLYVDEHLSAAKIARRYGLEYASQKTAESTVLYHLKKAGISRRDPAEHIRKVTGDTVDEWMRRYQTGESLKQIAGSQFSPVTVWLHLKQRKVSLRDKVEAQVSAVTKYQRRQFDGNADDAAYLIGFAKGDLYVTTHGRAVRVKTSTSHPAMSALLHDLFDKYGHIRETPRRDELTEYEWSLECDLDGSFAFLNDEGMMNQAIDDPNVFMSFLSGFFDAEGSVYFHKKSLHGGFEVSLSNVNGHLLQAIAERLSGKGFSPKVRMSSQIANRGVKNGGVSIWRLSFWRWDEVQRILLALKPRHPEKIEKTRIALKLEYRPSRGNRSSVISEWESLKNRIHQDRADYINKAETALNHQNS